jgi:hypothetical protein
MLRASITRLLLVVPIALLAFTAGCLSLGGRTTHVHDSPESAARIAALEARVAELEASIGRSSIPATANANSTEGSAFAR